MLILYLCVTQLDGSVNFMAASSHKREDVDTGSPSNAGERLIGAEGSPTDSTESGIFNQAIWTGTGKSLAPLCAWGDQNRKRVLEKFLQKRENTHAL
jgi:hypothetical protein